MTQLPRVKYPEPNPYRPDLPDDIRSLSPELHAYLRELGETIREQHNLIQTGDTTFSWELMTQVDLTARYHAGSLGRFYHPIYGIIHARYCRFESMMPTEYLGGPVGLVLDGGSLRWAVTNNIAKSSPDSVLGLGAYYVLPLNGSYGWVIVNGVNIQSLAVQTEQVADLSRYVWTGLGLAGEAAGQNIVSVLSHKGVTAISDGLWDVAPGFAFVALLSESRSRIREWIDARVATALEDYQGLPDKVFSLSEQVLNLSTTVDSINAPLADLQSRLEQESRSRSAVDDSLGRRVQLLESAPDSAQGLNERVKNLDFAIQDLDTRIGTFLGNSNDAAENLIVRLGSVEGWRQGLDGYMQALNENANQAKQDAKDALDKLASLTFTQLTDVPTSYTGSGGLYVRVNMAGTGLEFAATPAATAATTSFTPGGTISATDVQAALLELSGEKIQKISSSTDNQLVRWDGTGGGTIQGSLGVLDDSGNLNGLADISCQTLNPIQYLQFRHPNELDSNDGKIGAGLFTTGLNIVGVQTSPGGGRAISYFGDLLQASSGYGNVLGRTFVPDDPYDSAGWDGSTLVPTKNAIRDKIESLAPGLPGVLTYSTDADFTATYAGTKQTVMLTATLTANRTATLNTTNAVEGARWRFSRTGGGAFSWSVGGLKSLGIGTWCDVVFNGTSWILSAYGSL